MRGQGHGKFKIRIFSASFYGKKSMWLFPSNPQRRMLQVAKMRQAIVSQFICIVYCAFILLRVRNTNKQTNKESMLLLLLFS